MMGYAIHYGQPTKTEMRERKINKKRKIKASTVAVILAFVIYSGCTGKLEALRDWFIPGDNAITKEAFSELTSSIQRGEGFSDSIAAFCQEIISNAKEASRNAP